MMGVNLQAPRLDRLRRRPRTNQHRERGLLRSLITPNAGVAHLTGLALHGGIRVHVLVVPKTLWLPWRRDRSARAGPGGSETTQAKEEIRMTRDVPSPCVLPRLASDAASSPAFASHAQTPDE